jgi:hypothetical protein
MATLELIRLPQRVNTSLKGSAESPCGIAVPSVVYCAVYSLPPGGCSCSFPVLLDAGTADGMGGGGTEGSDVGFNISKLRFCMLPASAADLQASRADHARCQPSLPPCEGSPPVNTRLEYRLFARSRYRDLAKARQTDQKLTQF